MSKVFFTVFIVHEDIKTSHYHNPLSIIYASKDYSYTNLSQLIKNESIVVIPGDKDSCLIVMDKSDYQRKMQNMIKQAQPTLQPNQEYVSYNVESLFTNVPVKETDHDMSTLETDNRKHISFQYKVL